MSGSKGTCQPIALKCACCKRLRRGSSGNLVRTGRMRKYHRAGRNGAGRMLDMAYQCKCLVCHHVGWYAHPHVLRKAVLSAEVSQW